VEKSKSKNDSGFVHGRCKQRLKVLLRNFENGCVHGADKYPVMLAEKLEVLENC
jgi:predicted metalloprotease